MGDGGVTEFEGVEGFFGDHFKAGGAHVLIFVEIDLNGGGRGRSGRSGGRSRVEGGRVREKVLCPGVRSPLVDGTLGIQEMAEGMFRWELNFESASLVCAGNREEGVEASVGDFLFEVLHECSFGDCILSRDDKETWVRYAVPVFMFRGRVGIVESGGNTRKGGVFEGRAGRRGRARARGEGATPAARGGGAEARGEGRVVLEGVRICRGRGRNRV